MANSPLDTAKWSSKLLARVMTASYPALLHGFDLDSDLSRQYSYSEIMYLALTGNAPTFEQGNAFDAILAFASWAPVNEAPTHAAVLARICGGTPASILSVAATTLAEQSHAIVGERIGLVNGFRHNDHTGIDKALRYFPSSSKSERDSVEAFLSKQGNARPDVDRNTAIVFALCRIGITDRTHIEYVFSFAKLIPACAEALANAVGDILNYPTQVPAVEYDPEYQAPKRDLP